MDSPRTLFLAWQDDASRAWIPIGRLDARPGGGFRFVYTRGFLRAGSAGLAPLVGFPEVGRVYDADALFPLFRNRVMSPSREDYLDYLARLGIEEGPAPPLLVLARSEGRRSTDSLEIFPLPLEERGGAAVYHLEFFVRGLRHAGEGAEARALALAPGDPLTLRPEDDNPVDPLAVVVATADGVFLGHVPRYHCPDVRRLLAAGAPLDVRVARVNPAPTPVQQRLRATLSAPWPFPDPPLSGDDLAPLVASPR